MSSRMLALYLVFLLSVPGQCAYAATDGIPADERAAIEAAFSELPQADPSVMPEADPSGMPQPEQPGAGEDGQPQQIVLQLNTNRAIEEVLQSAGVVFEQYQEISVGLPHALESPEAQGQESTLGDNPGGWYWYLGKSYTDHEAAQSGGEAVTGKPLPAPDRQEVLPLEFLVTLRPDMSLAEAISRLKAQPDVEYVMPGYLLRH